MKVEDFDKETFLRVYRESNESINVTAKAFHSSAETIKKVLERYNIPHKWKHLGGRERTKAITKEGLETDYNIEGLNITQISVKYNVSKNILYQRFREYGIPLRKESKVRIDLSGGKYGILTVIKLDHVNDKGRTYWLCECECGNSTTVSSKNLRSKGKKGRTGSCGCMSYRFRKTIDSTNLVFPSFVWTNILGCAKDRGIQVCITPEYISSLFIKQNNKCAISGVEIYFSDKAINTTKNQTASLDRIDSKKDYVEGNVQWIHKNLQSMKMQLSQENFIEWCKIIAKHNENK